MIVLDGNFSLGFGPRTDYPIYIYIYIYIYMFQCIVERIDVTTNEVLELNTFVLACPTLQVYK